MQAVASTTSYYQCLYTLISTSNALPTTCNQNKMNVVLNQELNGNVLWEEDSLPKNAKSIMDTIFMKSSFTSQDIGHIHYQLPGLGESMVKGGPIFIPAGRGTTGRRWQLDMRNVQLMALVSARSRRKQKVHKKQKPRSQTSMAATNTEVKGLDSSLTPPDTDKSFSAQEYDEKNSNNKQVKDIGNDRGQVNSAL
ncbi:hypothetical protein DFH29DRAFT_881767 [Suillus ampliporus]|nr:hypothetical protein DFH29DRAFT_881767 [Suillus ampliporus]